MFSSVFNLCCTYALLQYYCENVLQEKFEDDKGAIRSSTIVPLVSSNSSKKNDKMTSNDLLCTETKD